MKSLMLITSSLALCLGSIWGICYLDKGGADIAPWIQSALMGTCGMGISIGGIGLILGFCVMTTEL